MGRTRILPTTRTMTKEKALELSGNLKSDGAAQTSATGRLGHGILAFVGDV